MGSQNGFSTGNLFLAAFLIASEYPAVEVRKIDTYNSVIHFKDSTELRQHVEHFWNGTATVSAGRLYQEYKMLTERVKS